MALTGAFEAPAAVKAGRMDKATAHEIEEHSCPGCGSCAGMFTANSMNCMAEILGLALPGNGTIPAVESQRVILAKRSGALIMQLVRENRRPRDIVTAGAIRNGLICDMALGCSTNTMSTCPPSPTRRECPLTCGWSTPSATRSPSSIVKLNPAGHHYLVDLNDAGGLSAVMRQLGIGGFWIPLP